MKIFKSASILLALFLLLGVKVEAASPKVIVSENGQVQVTNVGSDVVGIELSLQLSSGSFSNNAFVAANDTNYTFEKVSGNEITIYSTGKNDLASNGTIVLGNIQATSSVTFTNGTSLKILSGSLSDEIGVYQNVALENKYVVSNTGGTTSGTTGNTTENSAGTSTNTTDSNTSDDVSDVEDEVEEELDGELELFEDTQAEAEEYLSNNGATSSKDQQAFGGSLYLWLLLLLIILVGVGVVIYLNKPREKAKVNKDNAKGQKDTNIKGL